MNILIASEYHYPGYGGPYTAVSDNAKYLYNSNVKFKLLYKSTDSFNYNLNIKEIIKDYDIIHVYGIWTPFNLKISRIAKKESKKIIISTLGALEPWSLNQKKWKKKIAWYLYQKKILNGATAIHATSYDEKKHLIDLGIKSKIKVLFHGIKTQKINIEEKKEKLIKKAIFFSRIHPKKGLLELVDSWKILKPHDWDLDIYGPVSDHNYLNLVKKKIIKNGLYDKIKIYDPIYEKNKKKNIYTSADCFILPSKSENFGISIAEALSFGLPVLTTTSTPWKEINDYNAGIVFDFSQENLNQSLKKLLQLKSQDLKAMSNNAMQLIKDKYDYNKIIIEYINFYKSLI